MDPYVVLDLSADADDATIRAAYLTAVLNFPPERNPDMFEVIRAAYELIATEKQRLKYQLFTCTPVEPITIICASVKNRREPTLPVNLLRQLLKESANALIHKNLRDIC